MQLTVSLSLRLATSFILYQRRLQKNTHIFRDIAITKIHKTWMIFLKPSLSFGMCLSLSPLVSSSFYRMHNHIFIYESILDFLINCNLVFLYLNLVHKQFICPQLNQPMSFSAVNLLSFVIEQDAQYDNHSP